MVKNDECRSKRLCKICIVRRELAKKSGFWSTKDEKQRSDIKKNLLETLKKINELENQDQLEQQSSIESSDIKRIKIKKFGLVAAAASKFNTNLFLRRKSQNSENMKNISLDEWRRRRSIKFQESEDNNREDESKIIKKNFRQFSVNKREDNDESGQVALLTTEHLNNVIERTESDENLANLAKVILIEHKRSLQMSQTQTQDSSISYNQSTDSRRDSFSSRQDSSISVHENDYIKPSSKHGIPHKKNSNDWKLRRKNLMIKSKKWSNAFDEENQDSSLIVTTDESFASNSLIENAELHDNSIVFNEESSCSVHISAPDHNPQFQIKASFGDDLESIELDNVNTKKNARKLPELPISKYLKKLMKIINSKIYHIKYYKR